MEIKEGREYKARLPFLGKVKRVRVEYVLPSKSYSDESFVVYRYWCKSHWVTAMTDIENFQSWIENKARKEVKNG